MLICARYFGETYKIVNNNIVVSSLKPISSKIGICSQKQIYVNQLKGTQVSNLNKIKCVYETHDQY